MVTRDSDIILTPSDALSTERVKVNLPAMASPYDRVAAVVIDYFIVLLPFIYLTIAPFQRSMKQAAIIDDQWQISFSMGLSVVATLVLILFYQLVCVWLWGATVGKALMGLRVRSIWDGEKVSFSHALGRAVSWLFSWVFLGVPFLAAFSNYMRRPLHDRISDTVVISIRNEKIVLKPNSKEATLVQGVYWALATFIVLLMCSMLVSRLSKWQKETELISSLESEDVLCVAVSEAQAEWPPSARGEEVERLSVAMAMYAAGAIERKCLEGEVEGLYTENEDSLILDLARSFIYADHPDRSDMYLEKICNVAAESAECRFSKVISAVSKEDWDAVTSAFDELASDIVEKNNSNEYMAIWGVRQFIKREEYARAQKFMEALPEVKALADFYLPARTKILWGLQKVDEASGIESIAYSAISDEAKLDLASFLCFEQIWSSCDLKNSSSCKQMKSLVGEYDDSLTTVKTSLAYLRKWECDAGEKPAYDKLYSMPLQSDVRSLVLSLGADGTEGFNEILEDPAVDEELASEVSRRILVRTHSEGLIKTIQGEWEQARHTLAWNKLGETLFNKYFERKEYGESLKVADALIDSEAVAPKMVLESAIVAAFRAGQIDRARKILAHYAEKNPLPNLSTNRVPASTDAQEFIEILNELLKGDL